MFHLCSCFSLVLAHQQFLQWTLETQHNNKNTTQSSQVPFKDKRNVAFKYTHFSNTIQNLNVLKEQKNLEVKHMIFCLSWLSEWTHTHTLSKSVCVCAYKGCVHAHNDFFTHLIPSRYDTEGTVPHLPILHFR